MDLERRLRLLADGVEITLPPLVVPTGEMWAEPRDLELLSTASMSLDEGHTEAAVVLAQTVVEVTAEWALRLALRATVPEGTVDSLFSVVPDRSFMDRRTRAVWTALTGDVLSELPEWKRYHAHIERRNRVAHSGFRPTEEDARASISVCHKLSAHLETVIHDLVMGPT